MTPSDITELKPAIDMDALRKYLDREARVWGANVRTRRQTLGLTLAQVAALGGTTSQTVHKVERGEISARDHLRVALALALRTEVDTLFPSPKLATVLKEVAA